MTPNWDDPAVPRGDNPTPASDRYSLALIFLRIVGAANFPVQARQRTAGEVEVAFPVPAAPGADVLLDPAAEVWDLCGRGLSLHIPDDRPAAADWLGPLEDLLAAMGRQDLARAVRVAQGQGSEAPAATSRVRTARPEPRSGDVTVVPVPAPRRPEKTWSRISPNPRYGATPSAPAAARPIGYQWAPLPAPAPRLPVASAQSASGAITAGGGAARGVTRLTGTGGSGGTAPVVGSNRANAAARPNALTPPRATARPGATAQPNALAQPGAVAQPRAVARPNAGSGPGATGPVAASRITGAAPSPLGGGTPRPSTPWPGTPRPAGSPPTATATLPTTPTGSVTAAPGGPPTDGAAVGDATAPAPGPGAEARAQLARFLRWWWGIHGAMIHALATPGRRGRGARSLLFCLVVDIAVLVLTAAAVALVVSPITQG